MGRNGGMPYGAERLFNVKVFGAVALVGTFAMSTLAEAGSANGTWLRDNGAHVLAFD